MIITNPYSFLCCLHIVGIRKGSTQICEIWDNKSLMESVCVREREKKRPFKMYEA